MSYLLLGTIFNLPDRWLDAVVRILFITGLMTFNTLALTYIERKVIARVQQRLGPTRTGPAGLFQPVADALKLLTKEDLRPRLADRWVFELAPFLVFVPVFLAFVALPYSHDWGIRFSGLALFYILAVTSVNIVGWLMAGWGSDNKYALLGAVRAVAQMISYEIPLVLAALSIAMVANTLDLREIIEQQNHIPNIVIQPLPFILFIIAMMAELNRNPFDIPVAESEVVGGVTVEYSGIRWSFFQLAEYTGLFILAVLGADLFLGGYAFPWLKGSWFGWQLIMTFIKASALILAMMWLRATFPRLRVDQLMSFAWKVLIPLSFVQVFVNGFWLVYHWPGWGAYLGISSWVLLAILAIGIRVGVQRLGRRRPRAERLEQVRQLTAARGA
ncbi:MAG TPA: NADH-quinone oxidoreductase subunit NuoH [Dehalococcoidia bacterium]|nr:NADH-quinone oxidoreductase subunit NuoH [Dehalococcoidia bacterium]